ncbi:DsrE family protein [Clostridium polynesiense]|uniref:DsrE family protein n=1 Tax=Clostridium polynesiense TaxID=1325933 RepID=UPI00058FF4DD|nr:DsrE family protein [Clostridium polynesiense]
MIKFKALFHISEPENWAILLENVDRLLLDLGSEEFDLEVLVTGEAVKTLLDINRDKSSIIDTMKAIMSSSDENIMNRINELHTTGVEFVASSKSLEENEISPSKLYEFVSMVPAAVTEVVLRQNEGYAYIKM